MEFNKEAYAGEVKIFKDDLELRDENTVEPGEN